MKRLSAIAAFSACSLLLLTGCEAFSKNKEPDIEPIQSVYEIDTPATTAAPTTTSEEEDTFGDLTHIIYRERIYDPDSYTKSNLVIQADGTVWYGFYMHNEGTIDKNNLMWDSDGNFSDKYELDDDRWLAAAVTKTKSDDFALFGDITALGKLPDDELEKLNELISKTDPGSSYDVWTPKTYNDLPEYDEPEYFFTDLVIWDEDGTADICRAYIFTQWYEKTLDDQNALAAMELVRNTEFYDQWKEACAVKIKPY